MRKPNVVGPTFYMTRDKYKCTLLRLLKSKMVCAGINTHCATMRLIMITTRFLAKQATQKKLGTHRSPPSAKFSRQIVN